MSEKLQKVLARAGLGSRREIEEWIAAGRLTVNGVVATLGTRVEFTDKLVLDGRDIKVQPEQMITRKVMMYHKPEGEVTTRDDPEGRPTVFDRLPPLRGSRWIAVGRLDINTSGLLLFTNDGELANRLMHPSSEIEREYAVRLFGELAPSQRKQLQAGVLLDDGPAKFNSIVSKGGSGSNHWYHVTIAEGRTREVRRMFEAVELMVSRLLRVRYGTVALDPLLKQGQHRLLTPEEITALVESVGMSDQASRSERKQEVRVQKYAIRKAHEQLEHAEHEDNDIESTQEDTPLIRRKFPERDHSRRPRDEAPRRQRGSHEETRDLFLSDKPASRPPRDSSRDATRESHCDDRGTENNEERGSYRRARSDSSRQEGGEYRSRPRADSRRDDARREDSRREETEEKPRRHKPGHILTWHSEPLEKPRRSRESFGDDAPPRRSRAPRPESFSEERGESRPRPARAERSFSRDDSRGERPQRSFSRGGDSSHEGGEERRPRREGERSFSRSAPREGGEERRPRREGERSFSRSAPREGGEERRPRRDSERSFSRSAPREGGEERRPRRDSERSFSRGAPREGGEERRPRREFDGERRPARSAEGESRARKPRSAAGAARSKDDAPRRTVRQSDRERTRKTEARDGARKSPRKPPRKR